MPAVYATPLTYAGLAVQLTPVLTRPYDEFDYSTLELHVLSKMGHNACADLRAWRKYRRAPRSAYRPARPGRAHKHELCWPANWLPLGVPISMDWRDLPGWPARCPGAGDLGSAWRAIDGAAAAAANAWALAAEGLADVRRLAHGRITAMAAQAGRPDSSRASLRGMRSLLRHSSLRGQAREAIAAAVATSWRGVCRPASMSAWTWPSRSMRA